MCDGFPIPQEFKVKPVSISTINSCYQVSNGILSNLLCENMLLGNSHIQVAVSGIEEGILLRGKIGGVNLN